MTCISDLFAFLLLLIQITKTNGLITFNIVHHLFLYQRERGVKYSNKIRFTAIG